MIIIDFILSIIIYKVLWNLYYKAMRLFSDRYHSQADIDNEKFAIALKQGIISTRFTIEDLDKHGYKRLNYDEEINKIKLKLKK